DVIQHPNPPPIQPSNHPTIQPSITPSAHNYHCLLCQVAAKLGSLMKVGVFTVILGSMKFELVLDYLAALGVQAVEIGSGAYAGNVHCNTDELLASDRKAKAFLQAITSRGLQISSLSCHGNPLHPNKRFATQSDLAFRKSVRLASKLGVEVVKT